MRTILLAAFVAVASTQLAPAATAACAETHGSTAHVHSSSCRPSCLDACPVVVDLINCALIPDVHTTVGVNVECD